MDPFVYWRVYGPDCLLRMYIRPSSGPPTRAQQREWTRDFGADAKTKPDLYELILVRPNRGDVLTIFGVAKVENFLTEIRTKDPSLKVLAYHRSELDDAQEVFKQWKRRAESHQAAHSEIDAALEYYESISFAGGHEM